MRLVLRRTDLCGRALRRISVHAHCLLWVHRRQLGVLRADAGRGANPLLHHLSRCLVLRAKLRDRRVLRCARRDLRRLGVRHPKRWPTRLRSPLK